MKDKTNYFIIAIVAIVCLVLLFSYMSSPTTIAGKGYEVKTFTPEQATSIRPVCTTVLKDGVPMIEFVKNGKVSYHRKYACDDQDRVKFDCVNNEIIETERISCLDPMLPDKVCIDDSYSAKCDMKPCKIDSDCTSVCLENNQLIDGSCDYGYAGKKYCSNLKYDCSIKRSKEKQPECKTGTCNLRHMW